MIRTLVIPITDRADRAVAQALGLSRTPTVALFDAGQVRHAGKRVSKGARLEAGAVLEVELEEESRVLVPEPELPLQVLFESPALLVLDKPAGMACHPLKANERGTLANALVARFPECAGAGLAEREAGLCHRLDHETSGAILAARTREAFTELREQFRSRAIEKVYLALVHGRVETGRPEMAHIDAPLSGHGRLTKPWRGDRDGRELPATTDYRALWSDGESSLLEVRIETGVRHQIRAHLAFIGHPLRGDVAYGGAPWPALGRHLLHAQRLGFEEPGSGVKRLVEARLPADAQAALQALGAVG